MILSKMPERQQEKLLANLDKVSFWHPMFLEKKILKILAILITQIVIWYLIVNQIQHFSHAT